MNEDQLQAHLISGNVMDASYGPSARRPLPAGHRTKQRYPAPSIVCADGLVLSVQAGRSYYCTPRNNEGPYTAVEIGFPSYPVDELIPYAEDSEHPTNTVYAQVPVEIVLRVINSRGGVVLDQ